MIAIGRLSLTNFRNHAALTLETGHRHVVLTGENGAGKTNLLEAVSFFSPGRGMRRATLEEVGYQQAPRNERGSWSVFAEISGAEGEVKIGTGVMMAGHGPENQRRIRINSTPARTAEELLDHLRVVWLIPAMDGLFTGPASDRRRFLDRMVLAIDPAHGKRVADYEKAMRSRNRVLSDYNSDPVLLDALELLMAEMASAIATARADLVSLLTAVIIETSKPGSPFPDALVHLDGYLENSVGEIAASDVEAGYLDQLRNSRRVDAMAGRCLAGPHRSDLQITHRPKAMPAALCSTGEQKALLVGMVLAHARLVKRMHGHAPVLLLDEIAAHIDAGRRAALFDLIDDLGCQAFMTGTERALFSSLEGRASLFELAEGGVRLL